jgi:predicted type IV restriction endonuclease
MRDTIIDIRNKIASGAYKNEEHVRLQIVVRILSELGWKIWDPAEVNCEFNPVPHEDKTRVDIALFSKPRAPDVFIETKPLGGITKNLEEAETQLRNYNRDNTALISIITDGRIWRFYLPRTAGKFSEKCFKVIDLQDNDLDDVQNSFFKFLKKDEIISGNAEREANGYLRLSEKQRAMEDALPQAKRAVMESPYPSLPEALAKIVLSEKGLTITTGEAQKFIIEMGNRTSSAPSLGRNGLRQASAYKPMISEGEHLSETDLVPYIIRALKDLGGRARKDQVEQTIYGYLGDEFNKPWYQETVSHGIPRWQHNIAWAKERAKHDGLIKSPNESRRGYWDLTEKGKRYETPTF